MDSNKAAAVIILSAVIIASFIFLSEDNVTGFAVADDTYCSELKAQPQKAYLESTQFINNSLFVLNFESADGLRQEQAVFRLRAITSGSTTSFRATGVYPQSGTEINIIPEQGTYSLTYANKKFMLNISNVAPYATTADLNGNSYSSEPMFLPALGSRENPTDSNSLIGLSQTEREIYYNIHDSVCTSGKDTDCDGYITEEDPDCQINKTNKPVYCDRLYFSQNIFQNIRSEDYVAVYSDKVYPEIYKVIITNTQQEKIISFKRMELINNRWAQSTIHSVNINLPNSPQNLIGQAFTLAFPSWSNSAGKSRNVKISSASAISAQELMLGSGSISNFKEFNCTNGWDDDCDGLIDSNDVTDCSSDFDRDGYSAQQDCDDTNPNVNPGKVEIQLNGLDDDCNSATSDGSISFLKRIGSPVQAIPRQVTLGNPVLLFNVTSASQTNLTESCYITTASSNFKCANYTIIASEQSNATFRNVVKFNLNNISEYKFYASQLSSATPAVKVGNLSLNLTSPSRCTGNKNYGYSCGVLTIDDFANGGFRLEINSKEELSGESAFLQLHEIVNNQLVQKNMIAFNKISAGKYEVKIPLPDCQKKTCKYAAEIMSVKEGAVGGTIVYFEYGAVDMEICDGKDNDGDQLVDENITRECGFGACAGGFETCNSGSWSFCSSQNLSVIEQCDKIDNDCDNLVDENFDTDNDTYFSYADCASVYSLLDCDDINQDINPNATENCFDQADNNCDDLVDTQDTDCSEASAVPLDLPPNCGDGVCNNDTEDSEICCTDCGCTFEAENCTANKCEVPSSTAVCGNNVRESGEECDGADAESCTGYCTAQCACPFVSGDGYCDKLVGESADNSTDCKSNLLLYFILAGILSAAALLIYFLFVKPSEKLITLLGLHGLIKSKYASSEKLSSFVESGLSEGHSPERIKEALLNSGADKKKINSALNAAANKIDRIQNLSNKHKLSIATKDFVTLNKYINDASSKGYTPAQIKTSLIASGWNEKTIDYIISKHSKTKIEKDIKNSEDVKAALNRGHTLAQIRREIAKPKL